VLSYFHVRCTTITSRNVRYFETIGVSCPNRVVIYVWLISESLTPEVYDVWDGNFNIQNAQATL